MSGARRLLRRSEAAAFLTDNGYPMTTGTLTTKASTGGGPPFVRFGKYSLYWSDELLAWAQARSTKSALAAEHRLQRVGDAVGPPVPNHSLFLDEDLVAWGRARVTVTTKRARDAT